MTPPCQDAAVKAAFAAMPDAAQAGLAVLRALIFERADEAGITVKEALRWGQPAYLSPKGSTLRLGVPKTGGFAVFVHCRTRLIAQHEQMFPGLDRIEGTRAVLFDDPCEIDAIRHGWLISQALTYHDRAKSGP